MKLQENIKLETNMFTFDGTLLIPMAGEGSRFKSRYKQIKPLIKFKNKSMIEHVVSNMQIDHSKITFIVREDHKTLHIEQFLNDKFPQAKVVYTGPTDGAARTCLNGIRDAEIDVSKELIICNCDQIMYSLDMGHFMRYKEINPHLRGIVFTFTPNVHSPQFSYVDTTYGLATRFVEKQVISEFATTGVYYFRQASLFVDGAESMINANRRINNEFYVCPVYNELVAKNYSIGIYHINEHYSIGTPDELEHYKNIISNNK